MTQPIFVVVAPGADASIPTGPQVSAKYVLTGPDGTRAVFNDQSDRDYVGMLTEVSGFDSAEVRENADDLVQLDGGVHGEFFYGRRPMTLTGMILNPASADDRNRRVTKLMRASSAMREDGVLSWILEGGHEQFLRVRRAQPLRVEGNWQKTFQCGLVAADPRVYGFDLKTYWASAGQVNVQNKGNTLTYPVLTVYGPGTNPVLINNTTHQSIKLLYTLGAGDHLTLDTLNRTVMLNDITSVYGALDFLNSEWWGVAPDVNDIRITWDSSGAGNSLVVQFRDAWL